MCVRPNIKQYNGWYIYTHTIPKISLFSVVAGKQALAGKEWDDKHSVLQE